jgi:hypothetical protein
MPRIEKPIVDCFGCRFWFMYGYDLWGACRRRAPTQPLQPDGELWPETEADAWCGEGVAVSPAQLAAREAVYDARAAQEAADAPRPEAA